MKPSALAVEPGGIPEALKQVSRWVCWRYEQRNGTDRWAKILCTVRGRHAKSNDPTTWTSFADALAAYQRGGFDGIGFCLGDGWAGIDFDDCVYDPDDDYNDGARDILTRLTCYVELSPSGTGMKALGRSSRIGGEIKFDRVKPPAKTGWKGGRFFTITGQGSNKLFGDPSTDITSVLDELFPVAHHTYTGDSRSNNLAVSEKPSYIRDTARGIEQFKPRSDDDVLLMAAKARNSPKFRALFRGDISTYGDDRSKADLALVNILLFWCNGDLDQVDRLFRESALYRDKWEVRSYRIATLQKAVAMLQKTAATLQEAS